MHSSGRQRISALASLAASKTARIRSAFSCQARGVWFTAAAARRNRVNGGLLVDYNEKAGHRRKPTAGFLPFSAAKLDWASPIWTANRATDRQLPRIPAEGPSRIGETRLPDRG